MPGPALAHNASEYLPSEAEEYVRMTITQNSVLYATSALLVYELLTTFDEEVERVWSLKWRLPKLLFFLNRYLTRGLLFCRIYGYWQVIPARLAILAAQAVMIIRLWAIYNNSRQMLYLLVSIYTLEVAAMVTCMVLAVSVTQGASQPAPLSCALDALSPYLRQYAGGTWLAPVCFEFIILIITLVKIFPPPAWLTRRIDLKGYGVTSRQRNPTLDMLARDSIIYFTFIFTFSLANYVIYILDFAAYYRSILLGPTSAISCIAVSRMIINIRSIPPPILSHSPASSNVIFAENSDYYGTEATGVSEVPTRSSRSTSRTTARPLSLLRKEDGYEMVSTLRVLDDV